MNKVLTTDNITKILIEKYSTDEIKEIVSSLMLVLSKTDKVEVVSKIWTKEVDNYGQIIFYTNVIRE